MPHSVVPAYLPTRQQFRSLVDPRHSEVRLVGDSRALITCGVSACKLDLLENRDIKMTRVEIDRIMWTTEIELHRWGWLLIPDSIRSILPFPSAGQDYFAESRRHSATNALCHWPLGVAL